MAVTAGMALFSLAEIVESLDDVEDVIRNLLFHVVFQTTLVVIMLVDLVVALYQLVSLVKLNHQLNLVLVGFCDLFLGQVPLQS